MADEPITNGKVDEEVLEENGPPLQTIDLSSKTSEYGQAQPVLEFEQETPLESEGAASANSNESPIVGTEIKKRTRSGGSMNFKDWSSHHLKITKQLVQERFGHGTRTVDSRLERRIETLKETQKKYAQLISISHQFHTNFLTVVETQKTMAEHFAFMSVRAPELHAGFHYNAETQKVVSRNGETLLAAVNHFTSNMQTVCTKTMEDTLQTVKVYETARLSYDAYRSECENLQKQAATSQKAASSLEAANIEFEKHKKKFEQLRHDVDIKLKLLDENKFKVAHKQLLLLQGAFAAYFSCNHEAVDALLTEFKEKAEECENNDPPAWLEDLPSQKPSQ